MLSKISFYPFLEVQNQTKIRFRKDKQSYFQDFQKFRERQLRKRIKQLSSSKQKITVQSILVRSQQQKQLMSFLQLPNIKSKSKKKNKSSHRSIIIEDPQSNKRSQLQKILDNKSKFMKTYFTKLNKFEKDDQIQQIRHVFPEVRIDAHWSIKGYLKGKDILMRCIHKAGRQKYFKYAYSQYKHKIKQNYEGFVRQKFNQSILLQV